jgi:hypothetical protein
MSWWHHKLIKNLTDNDEATDQQKAQPVAAQPAPKARPRQRAISVADFSRAVDPAAPILRSDPNMTDEGRATAWDMFHGSKDHLELARKIQHVEMSNDTRHRLFEAKRATSPEVDPVAKVRSAIESVSQLDPNDLATAESHPTVLKLIGDAVIPKKKSKNGGRDDSAS